MRLCLCWELLFKLLAQALFFFKQRQHVLHPGFFLPQFLFTLRQAFAPLFGLFQQGGKVQPVFAQALIALKILRFSLGCAAALLHFCQFRLLLRQGQNIPQALQLQKAEWQGAVLLGIGEPYLPPGTEILFRQLQSRGLGQQLFAAFCKLGLCLFFLFTQHLLHPRR